MCKPKQRQSDISPLVSRKKKDKMPVDFATYLLASSPPTAPSGLDYYSLRDCVVRSHHLQHARMFPRSQSDQCLKPQHKDEDTTFIIPRNTSNDLEFYRVPKELSTPIPPAPSCRKKAVRFADDCGFSLTEIRIMKEISTQPPLIRTQFLSRLTHGVSPEARTSDATCPLQLQFKQPASDYARFRGCLDTNNVALENVRLKDYNVVGTVKVKNIGFEKTVLCRVTFNSWESCTDIIARYATTSLGQSDADSFIFTIDVPPTFDVKCKIEFAICFRSNSQEYWDNNQGGNYHITATPPLLSVPTVNQTVSEVFEVDDEQQWSSFSTWRRLRQNSAEDRYY